MKAIKKNIYAVGVIFLFIIAAGMLALFLALFSSSTSVDSTAVGSVYIGDTKPNSKERKQNLIKEVDKWKRRAIYTITFQNVEYVIGQTTTTQTDPETNVEKEVIVNNGLNILEFDVEKTNLNITNNKSNNLAYFNFTQEKKDLLFSDLQKYFGTEITDSNYFRYNDLVKAIEDNAQKMVSIETFDLYDYTNTDWNDTKVGESIEISKLSATDVSDLLNAFKETEIEILPQTDEKGKLGFSAVEFFSQPQFSTLSSSQMSIVATGIANVVMRTSMIVTVKNQGYACFKYYAAEGGYLLARVNIKDNTDLRIINPETHSYTIQIEEGSKDEDGTSSLRFILHGCKFINRYDILRTVEEFDNSKIVYDDYDSEFNYDDIIVDDVNVFDKGKADYNSGVYYYTYVEADTTKLISFQKVTTFVDGTTDVDDNVQVFPKQEFFVGQDELRHWTKKGYNA